MKNGEATNLTSCLLTLYPCFLFGIHHVLLDRRGGGGAAHFSRRSVTRAPAVTQLAKAEISVVRKYAANERQGIFHAALPMNTKKPQRGTQFTRQGSARLRRACKRSGKPDSEPVFQEAAATALPLDLALAELYY